eukprot:1992481-Lingulodinium_polyedra.AAC.1
MRLPPYRGAAPEKHATKQNWGQTSRRWTAVPCKGMGTSLQTMDGGAMQGNGDKPPNDGGRCH